jgi:DNA polymerase I
VLLLQILAHLAVDTELIQLFKESDDVFKAIAAKWLKKPASTITPEERKQVKTLTYGILYGGSGNLFVEEFGVSLQKAQSMSESLLKGFPMLSRFIEQTLEYDCLRIISRSIVSRD